MNPYFVMALLFGFLAVLAAVDASAASLHLLPWFNGLRWLRIHFITLGIVSEAIFGFLPALVAARAGYPTPRIRWDIWLTLNVGLLTLIIGVPLVNGAFMIAGGTLVFIATLLLWVQLMGFPSKQPVVGAGTGRKFYIAALSYLLMGVFLGTGMWLGWGKELGLLNTKEVHVHTNLWGFAALIFAGLQIDLYPNFAKRPLAWPRSSTPIFWLMTVGALGLVIGPWVQSNLISTVGLVLHSAGTVWLLVNVLKPLLGDRSAWIPGMWHLVTAYVWFLIPAIVAPLIVLNAPGFPVAEIESNGGPILIYGWMLQFSYAIIPYLFARVFLPDQPAKLGGNWFSLATVHIGGVLFWLGLFLAAYQPLLHGIAFALWALSMLPVVRSLWRIAHAGLTAIEATYPSTQSA